MSTNEIQALPTTETPKTEEAPVALRSSCRNLRVRTSVRAGAAMVCPIC